VATAVRIRERVTLGAREIRGKKMAPIVTAIVGQISVEIQSAAPP